MFTTDECGGIGTSKRQNPAFVRAREKRLGSAEEPIARDSRARALAGWPRVATAGGAAVQADGVGKRLSAAAGHAAVAQAVAHLPTPPCSNDSVAGAALPPSSL